MEITLTVNGKQVKATVDEQEMKKAMAVSTRKKTGYEKNFDMRFKELIGHTPLQVVCGFITGMAAAIALSFIPAFGVSIL